MEMLQQWNYWTSTAFINMALSEIFEIYKNMFISLAIFRESLTNMRLKYKHQTQNNEDEWEAGLGWDN